jgi:hypothetical protein
MTTNAMPKFNFSKATFTSEAALQEATGRTPGGASKSKVMLPGKHEVTIKAVEFKGMSDKDPSWCKYSVQLEGTGGKEIRDMILVPTSDIVFGVDKKLFSYRKLQNLMGALGTKLTVENLAEVLGSTFGRPESLVGSNLAVEVGFTRASLRTVRNDIGEVTGIRIVNGKTKQDLSDDNGVLNFPDYAAAEAHIEANNIPYDKFPSVLNYLASVTPSAGKKDSNW